MEMVFRVRHPPAQITFISPGFLAEPERHRQCPPLLIKRPARKALHERAGFLRLRLRQCRQALDQDGLQPGQHFLRMRRQFPSCTQPFAGKRTKVAQPLSEAFPQGHFERRLQGQTFLPAPGFVQHMGEFVSEKPVDLVVIGGSLGGAVLVLQLVQVEADDRIGEEKSIFAAAIAQQNGNRVRRGNVCEGNAQRIDHRGPGRRPAVNQIRPVRFCL
ncbi:hypothetical protein HUU39_01010 [candidate division KSB1 bacterium]|nr:hypothetical protein [candidate division KSB1 bacterium]